MLRIRWSAFTFLALLLLLAPLEAQVSERVVAGFLFDNTGSMRTNFESVRNIGQALARNPKSNWSSAIFGFVPSSEFKERLDVKVFTDWGQGGKVSDEAISQIRIQGGQSPLFDAIKAVVAEIDKRSSAEKDRDARRALLLFSDGEDRVSVTKFAELLTFIKDKNVAVYVVGFPHQPDEKKAKKILTQLAETTGGNFVFPKCKEQTQGGPGVSFTPECVGGFAKVAEDLLNTGSLAKPTNGVK